MARHRLLWQLYPSYLVVSLGAILAVTWYAAYALEQSDRAFVGNELARVTDELAERANADWPTGKAPTPELISLAQALSHASSSRLAVLADNGQSILDTAEAGSAPAVEPSLVGEPEQTFSSDAWVDRSDMVRMVPVRHQGQLVGWVVARRSLADLDTILRPSQLRVAGVALAVALLAAGLSLAISRRISRPLEELRSLAERLVRGDLGERARPPGSLEIAGLAGALNTLAAQLEDRLQTIVRQSNEQRAVLTSMVEGVLAVDSDRRIITLNRAAAELVDNTLREPLGRSLDEVVRNADLRRFAARVLASDASLEDDVILHSESDRVLRIRGTALRDTDGHNIGAVIVLSDVTQFRRLETIRRDFVANVSHELRTPIASIKGFVETLLCGAWENAEDSLRFLKIVSTQADRLNAIIEDLLSLSKIEQSEMASDLPLQEATLAEVVEAAVRDCQSKAIERDIRIRTACDPELVALVNSPLLEQAVGNLLDNAIKYSEPSDDVVIQAAADGNGVTISVTDHGCGIAQEHLPRLFERFYRVDKAQSRKLGGTGLGLAIVKHIVQAHHGRVTVESTPGEGSVFRIHLPVMGRKRRERAMSTAADVRV